MIDIDKLEKLKDFLAKLYVDLGEISETVIQWHDFIESLLKDLTCNVPSED